MPCFVLRQPNLLTIITNWYGVFEFPKQATTKNSALKRRLLKTEGSCPFLWPTCDCFILHPTKTPDDTCYLIYHKCLTILSKCVTSRYTNVKLAQGTVYARWTPPAPADKSAINGRSVWEPAASRRHLTSLIMNIHNKSQDFGCSVTLE